MGFLYSGNRFYFGEPGNHTNSLPPGTYKIVLPPLQSPFLQKVDDFSSPKKIYGLDKTTSSIILDEAVQSGKNTGVFLLGEKGSGKTLFAKYIARQANRPIIILDTEMNQDIKRVLLAPELANSTILIDEYDKIYTNSESQNTLLELLDGVYKTNMLWLLTSNNHTLSNFLENRLSRIKFKIVYKKLSTDIFNDVCDDLLLDKDNKKILYNFFTEVGYVNFDCLIETINMLNRHKSYHPNEILKLLNITADTKRSRLVSVYIKGKKITQLRHFGTPLTSWITLRNDYPPPNQNYSNAILAYLWELYEHSCHTSSFVENENGKTVFSPYFSEDEVINDFVKALMKDVPEFNHDKPFYLSNEHFEVVPKDTKFVLVHKTHPLTLEVENEFDF